MNILFYVEPLIELQKPYWKEGWVNDVCWKLIQTLQQTNESYNFKLITNEAIIQTVDHSKALDICVISQQELLRPFKGNYLLASSAWHQNTYSDEQLDYYKNLLHVKLDAFVPDIIITFTPIPFLKELFPNALILHHEFSIFSRLPYPTSWFLDPVGVSGSSFLNFFHDKLATFSISSHQNEHVENF